MPKCKGRRFSHASDRARNQNLKKSSSDLVLNIIDARFDTMTSFPSLRHFSSFSTVKQWTRKEQKSLLRQMLPVFTPLLLEIHKLDVVKFLRAVVDFIIIASYKTYNDNTLTYLALALFRMN